MLDIHPILGILAGVLSFCAFIPYTRSILRGESKPQRATWFIWTFVGFTLLASYYTSGATSTIWVPISYFFVQAFIAFLSIKYGVGGWTTLDKICIGGVIISVILWMTTGSPLIALLMGIVIDFLGLIPTVLKTYKNPKSEDRFAWSISFVASIINLFALQSFSISIVSYPAYMVFNTGLVFFLTFLHEKK
ncbi:MAG: hypothetical protein PHS53_03290 [Candidatus Pacebacteria bacterium]|nr:hypothetical protein [Candidatus Paceibacterota bacterium]MDD5357141.1 hypothetical protein [Candidatus Paceibacterota bacterium]